MAEGRENPARSFLSKLKRGDGRPGEFRKWVSANWTALFMLFFIFLLALFIRSYFAYAMSQDNGYIVSGGSDSYYWRRIIDYSVDTGKQLFWDPLTAYPDGIRNPRPPLYSMSVVVPAVIAQNLFKSLDDAVGFIFIWSTAFWGALTVVPTYFLGKETFGKRAGLVAAFFLAVMPSHVQRSVLSNADHDAIILFFIVLTFYFLLKAVKTQQHKKWVESWRSPASVRKGLADYFRQSRTPVLYSLMAGTAFGTVIMTWVGFGYAAVLILAYYIIQVLLNKFKGNDSMSVTLIVMIAMGFGYLISFPVYSEQALIVVRFDVPVYLFLAAMFFGILFVITRDLPWTMTLPAIIAVVVVGIAAISVVNPALGQAILSGQGYFVKSKLYSTIAEARAPRFSELAMSFGMVTFFLSLIGLVWAIIKIPKHATAEFIFIVVWLGAAIFMAISAGRFMFNAAPAFAIASAWMLVIVVDRLDFNSVRRSISGASGSYWQIFKKSVKVRHIVGALFLGFLIILPNVWYSIDAGIPSESKLSYDKQIYNSLPSFIQQKGYDRINGSNWYLGAFGYSLPLPTYYFPAAWSWFSQQDTDLPPVERPAYVAWWDYGFEAIQAGQHPTVADNFQNGYQLTGNALVAQSEDEAIAIFAYKLIEAAYPHAEIKAKMHAIFEKYGVSSDRMDAIVEGPGQPIIDEVLKDATVYGPMASDLSDANARIVAGRVELVKLGSEKLVSLYGDVCNETGWQIRYFMVDSRMFPLSGQNTGIFYAPAKLSDRRIIRGSTPVDFYNIKAVLDTGAEVDLENVKASDVVTQYKIEYKDMFWDSMFYRAMVGYSGSDIGQSNGGIPGLSGSTLSQLAAMPAWNMSHFRLVYRTAYYNPYPVSEIAFHRDAWRAVSLQEAAELNQKIKSGEIQGYVDGSATSYYQAGAVFLEYYAGAIVNGTVTTEEGYPVSGIRATVLDEYGIPHQTTVTDAQGHYSLLAPFGNVTISFTTGSARNQNLQGSTSITSLQFNVTDDQAMRSPYDLDGDGVLDYLITKDVVMSGGHLKGDIFWDLNGEGNYTAGTDELIEGVTVYAEDLNTSRVFVLNASSGSYDSIVPPGQYTLSAVVFNRNITFSNETNVTYGQTATVNLPFQQGEFRGVLFNSDGTPAPDIELVLTDVATGFERTTVTTSSGNFSFSRLLGMEYSLTTAEPGMMIFDTNVIVTSGVSGELNATIRTSSSISYRAVVDGTAAPYAVYMISNPYNPNEAITGRADEFGKIDAQLPRGVWTLYASYFTGTQWYAGAQTISTEFSDPATGSLSLQEAIDVTGGVRNPSNSPVLDVWISFEQSNGARNWVQTDSYGAFNFVLPYGSYGVTIASTADKALYSGNVTVQAPVANFQFKLVSGVLVKGTLYALRDSYETPTNADLAAFGELNFKNSVGNTFVVAAKVDGTFSMVFLTRSTVTLGLGNSGYSQWSQEVTFSNDSSGNHIVATPDGRQVSGFVTYGGVGLRNIQVSFLPDSVLSPETHATTGAGGYFTAIVPPSNYTVLVDQPTDMTDTERYQFSEHTTISPGSSVVAMDIPLVKRIELSGFFLGGGSRNEIKLEGPEEKDVTFNTLNYSLYLLPGTYSVYASTSIGGIPYANVSSVEVSASSGQHDLQLTRAFTVSGKIYLGSSLASKQVTITATASSGSVLHSKSTPGGSYLLNLPRGSYTLSFLLEDLLTEGTQTLYVEYFDDHTLSITGSDMTVNSNLDLRFDNTTLSGQVTGPDGVPTQALIEMFVNGAYGKSVSFTTAPSGEFSESVQPGDYTVYVTAQDRRVSLVQISLSRNVPKNVDIALEDGKYLSGKALVDGQGASLSMFLTSGGTKLAVESDANGAFSVLVPSMNFTLSASTSRIENGVSIAYSGSSKLSVGADNLYTEFSLNRDTKHGVTATWNRNLTQSALPGVTVTYVVQIVNTGNIGDTFIVSYTDQGAGYTVDADSSGVYVDFGADNRGSIEVQVTAGNTVRAGDNRISIQVRSKSTSSVRADVALYLNVEIVRSVAVVNLNISKPVTSLITETKFSLNNTGNAQDNFVLEISNINELQSLGWNAEIVDWDDGRLVPSVGMPGFQSTPVSVRFTAIRSNPDPTAVAIVIANSTIDPTISAGASIPVRLPDLSLGRGSLSVTRSDVTTEFDVSRVYVDLALMVALASLLFGIFFLRRKKGLGGARKDRGGAKK